jgi:hypothetical protein
LSVARAKSQGQKPFDVERFMLPDRPQTFVNQGLKLVQVAEGKATPNSPSDISE